MAVLLGLALGACGPSDRAPSIDHIDAPTNAYVGTELLIEIYASDPDGDPLSFGFESNIPDLATRADPATIAPATDGPQARFRWTPKASDVGQVSFDFQVSDGSISVTDSVTVDVRQEVGASQPPRFVKPLGSGTTLDLSMSQCLDLDIVVEDTDSANVVLAQEPTLIEGATLRDNQDKTGKWHWCPTSTQIAAKDRYRLNLSADDGENKTPFVYLIVLKSPTTGGCHGTAPTITHTPADVSTNEQISITAQVSDDQGLKSPPLLYYTTTAPPDPVDITTFTPKEATLTSGDMQSGTWTATIPNPVADMPAGSSAVIYYGWAAQDNDDGSCVHTTLAPTTGTYQMKVTNPGGSPNLGPCEECTADAQCGGAADNCILIGGGDYCGKGCSADTDCPQPDYQCSEASLTSVDNAMGRQCVPRTGSCTMVTPETCTDDMYEENDTVTQAAAKPALEAAQFYNAVQCPIGDYDADEDWYRIVIVEDSEITVNLVGDEQSDIDLQLTDASGIALATSNGYDSNETIQLCVTAGTYYARVYPGSLTPKKTSYTLIYTGASQQCCVDDRFEPDNNIDQARYLALTDPKTVETGRQICAGDDDWYSMYLFSGDVLYASLTFDQQNEHEDLDFHFHDADGVDLTPCDSVTPCSAALGQSDNSNESFSRPITADGYYYLRVHGYNGSENSYDICVSLTADQCPVY